MAIVFQPAMVEKVLTKRHPEYPKIRHKYHNLIPHNICYPIAELILKSSIYLEKLDLCSIFMP